MAGTVSSAWDKLYRALHATDPTNSPDGGHYLNVQGTVNIIGAGSGGTSQIDNSSFVPGGSSLTPIGGYYGGRQVASGNTAAPALNASSVLQVDVISTVGGGAGGGFASAAVYGSPLFPVYNVGSVNVVNAVGVTAPGGSMQIVGSINPHGVFAPGGSVNVVGSVNVIGTATVNLATHIDTTNSAVRVNVVAGGAGGGVANITVRGSGNGTDFKVGYASNNLGAWPNYDGGAWLPVMFPSGFYPTVNIVGGGAGGGFASVAVYGSPLMPVYIVGSVNVVNQAANSGFASVAVYGSPLMPVYNVGSVQVVNGSLPAINLGGSVGVIGAGGSLGAVNLGGSVGVIQLQAPWSFVGSAGVTPLATFTVALDKIPTVNLGGGTVNIGNAIVGSVNVTPVAAFSLAGVPVVSTLGSLVPTTWPISFGGSGYFAIAAAPGAAKNVNLYMIHLSTQASTRTWVSFQSPSGTFLTGSLPLAPGVGFNMNGQIPHPLLIGATNATVFIHANGTENMAGWAAGWIE